MSDYDNTNTIIMFKNDKGDNPKRPDLNGTINIDGTEYSFSLWQREAKSGTKFYSGPVEPKQKAFDEAKQAAQEPMSGGDAGDDIPFAKHLDFIGG